MTISEFNNKYADYIEPGHYGLDIYDEEVIGFLDRVMPHLTTLKDFKFSQIKMKFGMARFYFTADVDWDTFNALQYLLESNINAIAKK